MTDRLGELAGDVAQAPVRLVKLIGDAAMLVSNDPKRCSTRRSTSSPPRRRRARTSRCCAPGVAYGRAVARGGDCYGPPVNLASRITAVARPGSVLCDEAHARRRGRARL